MVVGNKLDLSEENRLVSKTSGESLCLENGGMLFIETSAMQNTNVETAFT